MLTVSAYRAAPMVLLFLVGALFGGCRSPLPFSSAGTLRVESLGHSPVTISGRYDHAVYADASSVETTFLLADANIDELMNGSIRNGQVIHIELLWQPRPGWTPTGASATNASIRYIVFSDGEVGVYGGAGFAMPHGDVGSRNLTVTLRDASLKLLEQTDGFVDLLTPARLSGTFTARHNPRRTRQMHFALSQTVTNVFGRSMFVFGKVPDEGLLLSRIEP